ncbi:hypothetical protein FM042_10450 [Aliidiomarina halalkaliphila]|uniref:Uncharacterized protein n=1 Tax=Aliidiomarina halalkaliphila TaxID=2593535 RepID=A0A552WZ16_9GAMM|nr:hypothetical protein [Aliidiomarina halalkaliphila]TRW48070.1 hypothetical protein FM042_10450 [Aliidiomarina halalkaliphila]
MEKLVFQHAPQVELGTNKFINCPTILQFDDTPLIEVVRLQEAGFSTQIPIYHSDGTYLAKVVGSQLFATPEGKKAGIELDHPDKMTVCRLGGQTLFEIRREGAAALKTAAELYTPTGHFVRYAGVEPALINNDGQSLQIGGMIMTGNTITGCRIGVWIKSDGSIGIGCG